MSKNLILRKRIKSIINNEKKDSIEKFEKNRLKKKTDFGKVQSIQTSKSETGLKVNELRLLIKEDMKKTMEKLSENRFSRDISHLQDKRMNSLMPLPILPMDIEVLKKMKECECSNFHSTVKCKRENCLNEARVHSKNRLSDVEFSDSIDKFFIGNPTGRQDIKELSAWFHSMLSFHQNSNMDTLMLIYNQCTKELIRQVAVNCLERGELLQILFKYQADMYQKKIEESEKNSDSRLAARELEIKKLKEKIKLKQKEMENKLAGLKKKIENSKNEKEKLMDEMNKCKKMYNETVRQYMEEEKMWKKKHFSLLMKLKESFVPFKIGEHELSVVNWVEKKKEFVDEQAKEIVRQEIMEYEALCSENQQEKKEYMVEIQASECESEENLNAGEEVVYGISFDESIRNESYENESYIKLSIENCEGVEGGEKMENKENVEYKVLIGNTEMIENIVDNEVLENVENEEPQNTQNSRNEALIIQDFVINSEDVKNDVLGSEVMANHEEDFHEVSEKNIEEFLETEKNEDQVDVMNGMLGESEKIQMDSRLSLSTMSIFGLNPRKKILGFDFMPDNEIEIIPDFAVKLESAHFLVSGAKNTQARKSKKKLIKIPNRPSRDINDNKSVRKNIELQQTIESLKQQLQLKSKQLSEISSQKSKFSLADRLKINIVSSSLAKSADLMSPNHLSPKESTGLLSPPPNKLSREDSSRSLNIQTEPNKDLESDYDEKFIPVNCDIDSWKAGFSMGFEKGRTEGIQIGELLGIEEGNFENPDQDKDEDPGFEEKMEKKLYRGTSLKTDMFKKKNKDFTKIMQFQFNNRPGNSKKLHPVYAFINKLVLDREGLGKATLSRKIVNKIISSVLMNCLNKIRCGDDLDSLVEQVYDDFYQKYGLKSVCEKRFTEFLASLLFYSDFRRISVFLRLLGFRNKFDKPNYTKKSFFFYLSTLSYMMSSKLGIIIVFDEIADRQMFPTQRGIECLKEKLENICEKNEVSQAIEQIMNQSERDKKGINPSGLVELEYVLELAVNIYEEYQIKIENGVNLFIEALNLKENIPCLDFILAAKYINYEKFDFLDDEKNESKKISFSVFCKEIENKENFSVADVFSKCLELGLLKLEDFERFVKESGNVEDGEIERRVAEFNEDCEKLIATALKKGKNDVRVILEKLQELVLRLGQSRRISNEVAFHILTKELQHQIIEP